MNLFKLFGTIAINNHGANQAIDDTTRKASGLGSKIKNVFAGAGKATLSFGKVVFAGLGAATTAIGGLTIKSLGMLGSLEQNLGGTEVVFGRYADGIKEKSKTAFREMGLSQNQFLQSANKMGSLFKGSGLSVEKSAELTIDTMERAADVAAIMGIDTETAMQAVEGMAKGNFTMMDNLGVAINDTTLKAYALEKGITKPYEEMTTGEKVLLAQEYFMLKTGDAAGRYAEENNTLAGSLSTAKAALMNFLSGTGTVDDVVDSFLNATNAIIKSLDTLLPHLVDGAKKIIKKLTPQIPKILKAALPGILSAATMLIVSLAEVLPDLVEILIDELPSVLGQLWDAISGAFPALLQSIQTIIESIDFKALGEWFGNAIVNLIQNLPQIFEKLGNAIAWAWENVAWPFIQGLFKAVFGIELPEWKDVGPMLKTWWTETAYPKIQGFFYDKFGIKLPEWSVVWENIKTWWGNVSKNFVDFFKAVFSIFTPDNNEEGKPWYQVIIDWVAGILKAAGKFVLSIFGLEFPKWEDVKQQIDEWWQGIVNWWNSIPRKLGFAVDEPSSVHQGEDGTNHGGTGGKFATGLERVPYNEFPAILHRNEAVLTASEASAWRSGTLGGDLSRVEAGLNQVAALLAQIAGNTSAGNNIVLDSGALVGQLMPQIDSGLGAIAGRKRRG